LELTATDTVALRCRNFEVQATETVQVTGQEMRVQTSGDVHIDGDYIRLNCAEGPEGQGRVVSRRPR
jgi:hypothetical protein